MGKALLFLVATMALTTGVLMFTGLQQSVFQADEELGEQAAQLLARQVALTGLSDARTRFLSNPGEFTGPDYDGQHYDGQHEGGSFTAVLTPSTGTAESTMRIRVEGTVPYGNTQEASHTIETVYKLSGEWGSAGGGGPSVQVPEFMSYGLLTNEGLSFSGNADIGKRSGPNTNVHTNQSLSLSGNSRINGFASYSTTYNLSGNSRVRPNHNPDNLSPIMKQDQIEIPEFKALNYKDLADEEHNYFRVTGNDDVYLGTHDDPFIIYARDGISISGNTKFYGYGIFITDGDISLSGNMTLYGATNNENTLALYTSTSIKVSGNSTLRGQVLAGENAEFTGNSWLCGTVTVTGGVSFSGNSEISHCNPSPALTEPIWPSESSDPTWQATTYREWSDTGSAG